MTENTPDYSYDEQLSGLSDEQKKSLISALKEDVISALSQSLQKPKSGVQLAIPQEDSQALAEYRRRHNLKTKGKGKAKNIREQDEYWEIVAQLNGAITADEARKAATEPLPATEEEKAAIEEAKIWISQAKERLASIDTIDQVLAEVGNLNANWTGLGTATLNAICEIFRSNPGERYSYSDEIASAVANAIEDVKHELSYGDLSKYNVEKDYERSWGWHSCYNEIPITSVDDILELIGEDEFGDDSLMEKLVFEWEYGDTPYSCIVNLSELLYDTFFEFPEAKALLNLVKETGGDEYLIHDELDEDFAKWRDGIRYGVTAPFTDEFVLELIRNNPHYTEIFEADEKFKASVLDRIPDDPIDAYPRARAIDRHFVLHVGPTNSGKTHDAMVAMAAAPTGIYLAPLRLLAFEQYEKLDKQGVPCCLLTGEESRGELGTTHMSATVEMLDFTRNFDVAVIDEAQMMSDPDRGHRWTEAIIGVAAHEVHVCMAPEAKDLVVSLIEACGDTWKEQVHDRMTPLVVDKGECSFPADIRKGDAVIVFSRRTAHAVAAELTSRSMKVSLIYGSLPYDVRHAQAEKFASGESDVVVATDAIGMGMNLPIHRIVFLEQAKYDGHSRRFLNASEVKQIAGRAGRYGVYDQGLFTSVGQKKEIKRLMRGNVEPLTQAPLGFPSSLLNVSGCVSMLMTSWVKMEVKDPFAKNMLEWEIEHAKILEKGLADQDLSSPEIKKLVYRFATMPFKDSNAMLEDIWKRMFACELAGKTFSVSMPQGNPGNDLGRIEDEYALMDLLFQYCRMFGYDEYIASIDERRQILSDKIMELLGKEDVFEARRCRECGCRLPWNWPYPMCDPCHETLYPSRYYDDYYW